MYCKICQVPRKLSENEKITSNVCESESACRENEVSCPVSCSRMPLQPSPKYTFQGHWITLLPAYCAALSQHYSISSFARLRVLRCLYSPVFRCSCCSAVRFWRDLETWNLATASAASVAVTLCLLVCSFGLSYGTSGQETVDQIAFCAASFFLLLHAHAVDTVPRAEKCYFAPPLPSVRSRDKWRGQ